MNLEQYLSLLENPELLAECHIPDLRAILEESPYCATTRMMLQKALHNTASVHFEAELARTVIYASSPRALYFYIHPDEQQHRQQKKSGGSYFDMLDAVERSGQDSQDSLRDLAAKLKAARQSMTPVEAPTPKKNILAEQTPPAAEVARPTTSPTFNVETSQMQAQQFIKNKDYDAAIVMLQEIAQYASPLRKTYIEDQIRFLQKIK